MPVAEILNRPPPAATPRRSLLKFFAGVGGKSFWALADQGVSSIGNFLTGILVARNLSDAAQLGVFGMLTEVFFFLNSLQGALVIYPLSVKGAVLDRPALRRLATGCMMATLALCLPLSLAMVGTGRLFSGASMLLLWAPLAVIFQQLQETIRRTLLAHLRFRDALPGDAISYLGQAALLWIFSARMTLPLIFAIMAITSAAALIVQTLQIGLRRFSLKEFPKLAADFWEMSRWILYSNLATLVASLSYNWVLALSWNVTPVGYFTAIAYMAKLVNPIATAVSSLIIPSVARAKAGGGTRFAMRVGLRYASVGAAMLFPYFGILFVAPAFCMHLFYGNRHPEYFANHLPTYLRVLVVSWTFAFITTLTLAILNGLGYSKANFISTLWNAIVTAVVALPLIYFLGLKGTIIGGFLATVTATVVAVAAFVRHHGDATDAPPAAAQAPLAQPDPQR